MGGLRIADTLLGAFAKPSRAPLEVAAPRRILLAIGGHLGDAVIASSVFPLIRSVWPDAEIGVLTGTWSQSVLRGHPLVRWIHTVDHWKLIRSGTTRLGRLRRHAATRSAALREIREVGYDVAVDLHAYFPNSIPLLWQAGIPVRAGYTTGGFGALLTHAVPWTDSERHQAEYHRSLLGILDPLFLELEEPRYSLPPARKPRDEQGQPGSAEGVPRGDYLLLHMGAGLRLKEWPPERWHVLAERLLEEGHTLVFTGSGAEQQAQAERVIAGRSGCHNLCDRLDWEGFVSAVAAARLVVSVDSVAGHLAAGSATPAVVLMSGMNRIGHWRPLGDRVQTLTHPVPCAPCHQSRGCASMACVRGITVEEVLGAVRAELARDVRRGGAASAVSQPEETVAAS